MKHRRDQAALQLIRGLRGSSIYRFAGLQRTWPALIQKMWRRVSIVLSRCLRMISTPSQ
jgi:hypothetical protein